MNSFQQPANSWAVELQCPQCGAPVTLDEADRILTCAYCRVRLLIIHQDYPQYYLAPFLEQKNKSVRELFYVPYWRIRGMAFPGLQTKGKERVVETTFLATQALGMPSSLGLQTRAFRLRFLSPAPKGWFLKPQIPLNGFLSKVTEENSAPTDLETIDLPKIFRSTFIGETISRVYAPIYFQSRAIFDGLGDRSIGRARELDYKSKQVLGAKDFPPVRFLPVICPYCGADLKGEKDTQVLICRNCDRVWEYTQAGLKQIIFKTLKSNRRNSPAYYLPFWNFKARVSGWPGQILRPFTRPSLVSGPSPIKKIPEEQWVLLPAFKITPSLFLTVSRAASLRQPLNPFWLDSLPPGQYYPVTLPPDQAAEGLNAIIADFVKNRPIPRNSQITIETMEHLLTFIPFHPQGSELVNELMSLGISQTALHFGRFL